MVEPNDPEPIRDAAGILVDLAEEGADPFKLGSPFRERLSTDDWRALEERGQRIQYSAGEIVFQEGDTGDDLYVVLSGRVAVLKHNEDGQSALLAYRGPGDVLGEMGVMSRVPRSATLVAVEDSEMLHITGRNLLLLTDSVPGICRAMLRVLAERLRAADVARTVVVQEERNLARQLQTRTTEAERLVELARLRQQTIDLIVHDLRSPLSVIRGCLDMIEESLSAESRAASASVLGIARRSTQRLLDLVEALLDAARREVLGIELTQSSIDVRQLLQTAVDGLRATARSLGITLELDVPNDLPQISGDREQLERVVSNLVDNAVSYTPEGGRVAVAASFDECELIVSVSDTGPGIPSEYRDHIFERFARVPGVEGRRQGFGLGLYFCRQVIQAHGGRIWVESGSEGVGSRFAFALSVRQE